MKKRGAAALLAAICLLAGCAASDPALPAETPTPTETSSPAYQGDSLFAYCTERQRELLELPHEEPAGGTDLSPLDGDGGGLRDKGTKR